MYNNGSENVLIGLFFGMMIFSLIISLIVIISNAKVFKKAGKDWWASLIPIYNYIVMLQIAKLPIWYLALFFIPIANIYVLFKINIEIAKKFGKTVGFGIGMTLLGVIFIPLLAFSDNKYEDNSNENINTNNIQEFNVMNVINDNINSNINDTNLNEQSFNTLTESIPQNNSNTVEVENNILANAQTNEIPIAPLNIEQTEIESSVELANDVTPVATTIDVNSEAQIVEPIKTIDNIQPEVNAFNINPEPQIVEPIETIDNVQPEVNAFNINPEPQIIETIKTIDNVQPEVNAININPEPQIVEPIETIDNVQQSSNENILAEPVVIMPTETISQDKKCKNCGNDLPEIVSICPNCGTDNE